MKWITSISQSHINARKVMSSYQGQTMKMRAYNAIAGEKIRLNLSNQCGENDVSMTSIVIKQQAFVKEVFFSHQSHLILHSGEYMQSDEIIFNIEQGEIEIEIKFDKGLRIESGNYGLFETEVTYVTAAQESGFRKGLGTPIFASLDVYGKGDALVLCGDSFIHQSSWPQVLQAHLINQGKSIAVINHGISGNQWLSGPPVGLEYYGPSIQSRFNRDVLDLKGASIVVLNGGVNDILLQPELPVSNIISAYQAAIECCHIAHLKVVVMTLPPAQGYESYHESMQSKIEIVNEWMRTQTLSDGIVDVYEFLSQDGKLKDEYDQGDHLHPNEKGSHMILSFLLAALDKLIM